MHSGPLTLGRLIDVIKAGEGVSDAYYVYAEADLGAPRRSDTPVYIDKAPTFDPDNNEVLPDAIKRATLAPLCSIELIQSVISNAIKQNSLVTNAEIVSAFDYYMENDDFMEIGK